MSEGIRCRWDADAVAKLTELLQTMNTRQAAEAMGRPYSAVKKARDRFHIRGVPQHLWYTTLTEEQKDARRSKILTTVPGTREAREAAARANVRRQIFQLTVELVSELGGACCQCGEARLMLLQADHVNNDGAEHRKQGNKGLPLYKEMLRVAREEPGRLQLLCANCHLIKTRLESRGWDVFEELMGFDPLLPLPTIRT